MKKLKEIPIRNDKKSMSARNSTLVTMMPENGVESNNPAVNGMMVIKI
jgi:hypothetical protein